MDDKLVLRAIEAARAGGMNDGWDNCEAKSRSDLLQAVNDLNKMLDLNAKLSKENERHREYFAKWMIDHDYATGHGDSIEDLLKQLEWQMEERERKAFEAGWEKRGNACYPSPQDWEFEIALEAFKEAQKKRHDEMYEKEIASRDEEIEHLKAKMERLHVQIARLEGELEVFRKHHKEAQK